MAREARKKSKSGNYYILLKGSGLCGDDADKQRFNEIVSEKFSGGKVYGISVSDSEIHMAVKETEMGISMDMKSVTTMYARYINSRYGREGKLFEGRFKSEPLETKKELDECVKNLGIKVEKPETKKKPVPKKDSKKTVKAEKKTDTSKQQPKKNLPSWLL